ncbi:MAG: acetylglutamate kinase [Coriobacteriia bacterium]|nr:acetylglutamate kinase [Coriobacteriia bacterium]
MNYSKDSRPNGVSSLTADVLVEAMPWIKNVTGKTVVIKYGGAAMIDEQLRADVMADIVLLKIIGIRPVLVHGGGKAINAAMEKAQMPVEFVDGQRVTTDEAMDLVRMVLTGKVNQELVEAMNVHGNLAVGLSGADAGTVIAEQMDPRLGRVGRVKCVNAQLIEDLVESDYIPIIASIARGEDGGCYNVNADVVAGNIAAAIGAHKVVYLSDVNGLYRDFDDKDSLISRLSVDEAEAMVESGSISTGMIPKLRSCVKALRSGVQRAHMLNGTTPHSLLLELLTDKGIGTMVTGDDAAEETAHPLDNFAAKLSVAE